MLGGPGSDQLTDSERALVQDLTKREATDYERGFLDGVRHRLVHGSSLDRMLVLAAEEHQREASS